MATIQPPTTQLEFHQAMADFKTMFPSMDDDVIEAVLRSNQGAVDATIDQLLCMSSDNETEKIRNEFDMELVKFDSEPPESRVDGRSSLGEAWGTTALRTTKGWNPPLLGPLPHDFLRLAADAKQVESDLEDERIAILLQNEEFMAELRWNKDFLSTLDSDSPTDERHSNFHSRLDDEAFKERLRNMGKMSRKKFSQLARVFTGKKKRAPSARSILNEGVAPSKDNILLRENLESDY